MLFPLLISGRNPAFEVLYSLLVSINTEATSAMGEGNARNPRNQAEP
jgi:hypothetical protein